MTWLPDVKQSFIDAVIILYICMNVGDMGYSTHSNDIRGWNY